MWFKPLVVNPAYAPETPVDQQIPCYLTPLLLIYTLVPYPLLGKVPEGEHGLGLVDFTPLVSFVISLNIKVPSMTHSL